MEFIQITQENLQKEHICCAIASNKDCQVLSKKSWLGERLDEGLVFLKADDRGKCFIEYIPAEYAWAPVEADGWLYIDCLWVAGRFKGFGYANVLLQRCIDDCKAMGKKGIVDLSSVKKEGFLSDPQYLKYKGFQEADEAPPYFRLLALPVDPSAEMPKFCPQVKQELHGDMAEGFTIYYTNQCPYTAKYVPLLEKTAEEKGAALHTVHIQTREQAKAAPCPFTTFSLFFGGRLVTHEIQSEKKFEKIIDSLQPAEK